MVNYAFNLGMWTILFFILGMYKPQWPLFFLKKPDRFMIVVITTILVMITVTLYGEGTRRAKLEQAAKLPVPQDVAPVPVPVPAPETPVKK
jgi:Mg2+/citrate symporter